MVLPTKIVPRLNGGYKFVQQGIQFQMTVNAGSETTNLFGLPRSEVSLALNCWRYDQTGTTMTVVVELQKRGDVYRRVQCSKMSLKKNAKPGNNRVFGIDQILTRPLTIEQPNLPTRL